MRRMTNGAFHGSSSMRQWRASWSPPTRPCWGPEATPGKTGKLTMWTQEGGLVEEQLLWLNENARAQRLAHLQAMEHCAGSLFFCS